MSMPPTPKAVLGFKPHTHLSSTIFMSPDFHYVPKHLIFKDLPQRIANDPFYSQTCSVLLRHALL